MVINVIDEIKSLLVVPVVFNIGLWGGKGIHDNGSTNESKDKDDIQSELLQRGHRAACFVLHPAASDSHADCRM